MDIFARIPARISKALFAGGILAFSMLVSAADTSVLLAPQSATSSGSNGSVVIVGTGGTSADGTATGMVEYVNKDSDQTIF